MLEIQLRKRKPCSYHYPEEFKLLTYRYLAIFQVDFRRYRTCIGIGPRTGFALQDWPGRTCYFLQIGSLQFHHIILCPLHSCLCPLSSPIPVPPVDLLPLCFLHTGLFEI